MSSTEEGSPLLGFFFLVLFFGTPALVLVDDYRWQTAQGKEFSVPQFVKNIRSQEAWIRPFRPAVSAVKEYARGTVGAQAISTVLPQEHKIVAPAVAVDEFGKRRRVQTYLGEFDWAKTRLALADKGANSAIDIWLHHLSRFRYSQKKLNSRDLVWQTVAFTHKNRTGVCRDSATLLTDWLDFYGYDARIALGIYTIAGRDELHAWTVIRSNGIDYILESTGYTQEARMRSPPRAQFKIQYWPTYQVKKGGDLWHPEIFPPWTSSPPTQLRDYQLGWIRVSD